MNDFAKICYELENQSSILKKVSIIAQYLKSLESQEELYLASIYLSSNIYPVSSNKVINVGLGLIRKSIIELFGISIEIWNKYYKKHREIGNVIEDIFKSEKTKLKSSSELFNDNKNNVNKSLIEFKKVCDQLNENSKNKIKIEILKNLFKELSPLTAKYIARLLTENLRIGVQESTIEVSISKAFDIPKSKISHTNFYIGNIGEVAVRAKQKNFENIEFQLFHPIKPMLATAETNIEDIFSRMGDEVWAEYKYDGIRAHVHKNIDKVKIYSRDLKDITNQFPEIVNFFKDIEKKNSKLEKFLLDGEIVAYQNNKIMPFAYLQRRLGRKDKIEEEANCNPTIFIAYDILVINDKTLFESKLKDRRKILIEYFKNSNLVFSTQKIITNKNEFKEFFNEARKEGREGLMIKNPDSKYEPGKRGLSWLKYKQTLETLDVVILQAEYGEGKNSKYLSMFTIGVWDEKKENILPIARVSSGASEEDLEYLTKLIPKISTEVLENGYKLEPKIILEVGYENIQISDRFNSGYALRFPRIIRIREDKTLEEINTINDVKNIYSKIKGLTTK